MSQFPAFRFALRSLHFAHASGPAFVCYRLSFLLEKRRTLIAGILPCTPARRCHFPPLAPAQRCQQDPGKTRETMWDQQDDGGIAKTSSTSHWAPTGLHQYGYRDITWCLVGMSELHAAEKHTHTHTSPFIFAVCCCSITAIAGICSFTPPTAVSAAKDHLCLFFALSPLSTHSLLQPPRETPAFQQPHSSRNTALRQQLQRCLALKARVKVPPVLLVSKQSDRHPCR